MKICIEVEENGAISKSAECEASSDDTVEVIVTKLAGQLGIEAEEILTDLGTDGVTFEKHVPVREYIQHGHRWLHRRVCIKLHFETEKAVHYFPSRAHWARVHRWGCDRFDVAHDACANLELREGTETGPALNEALRIGVFLGCKIVWLVKPGPEQNGRCN